VAYALVTAKKEEFRRAALDGTLFMAGQEAAQQANQSQYLTADGAAPSARGRRE
jgi:hypothetical protein